MAPSVTHVIVHEKPVNGTLWIHHCTPGWYIGTSLDYYRCMLCYMPETGKVRITDTLQYIPKSFAFPKITTEEYRKQAIRDNIEIMKDPPKTPTFFPMVMQKKSNQSDCSNFAKKHISVPHKHFTVTPNATTDSEWKYPTNKNCQYTSTRSKGGTIVSNFEGENTIVVTHAASNISAFHIPWPGYTNIQPTKIASIPAPDPRVEPLFQTSRVKTQ